MGRKWEICWFFINQLFFENGTKIVISVLWESLYFFQIVGC